MKDANQDRSQEQRGSHEWIIAVLTLVIMSLALIKSLVTFA